jgi:hypothetical protein
MRDAFSKTMNGSEQKKRARNRRLELDRLLSRYFRTLTERAWSDKAFQDRIRKIVSS